MWSQPTATHASVACDDRQAVHEQAIDWGRILCRRYILSVCHRIVKIHREVIRSCSEKGSFFFLLFFKEPIRWFIDTLERWSQTVLPLIHDNGRRL